VGEYDGILEEQDRFWPWLDGMPSPAGRLSEHASGEAQGFWPWLAEGVPPDGKQAARLVALDTLFAAAAPDLPPTWSGAHDPIDEVCAALAEASRQAETVAPDDPTGSHPLPAPATQTASSTAADTTEGLASWLAQAGALLTGLAYLPRRRRPQPRKATEEAIP
jgi:hypothetical protein